MKTAWKIGCTAVLCASSLVVANAPAQAYDYTATNLGELSRALWGTKYTIQMPENKAYDINDNGQVIGTLKGWFNYGAGNKSESHIIVWDQGTSGVTARDLGSQPMAGTYGVTNKSYAYGINNVGQMAGFSQYASAFYGFAGSTDTGTASYIGKPTGTTQTTALAINDSGKVVGYTGEAAQIGVNAPTGAFIYDPAITSGSKIKRIPGVMIGTVYNSVAVNSSANAISNTGYVTGVTNVLVDGAYAKRAFVYDSNGSSNAVTLGTLAGGTASYGNDINDSGTLVGWATNASGIQHAMLYSGGVMSDLGSLAAGATSEAKSINNSGVIVGTSNGHAFVYKNNTMYDLNNLIDPSLGMTLTVATSINSSGGIVGYGKLNSGGEERAFLLTATPTPIPPAMLLFGSGLAGLGFIRRRKSA